jgi:hypothetical protein
MARLLWDGETVPKDRDKVKHYSELAGENGISRA